MVSPDQKRAAVRALRDRGRPAATACRRVRLPRSTWHYAPRHRPDEAELKEHIHDLADRFPRFGYRRITVMLEREERPVNAKRVQRIWQEESLQIPRRPKKKRRWRRVDPWPDRARCKDHVWSVDILFDRTMDGRQYKVLSVLDEFTRECLVLHAARSISARDVAELLEQAALERGAPAFVRSDNGPEFVALALQEWAMDRGSLMRYIKPGSPWQNACVESFHDKLRDELLQMESFVSLAEARVVIDGWRQDYNRIRPHSSLGYLTPAEFAARPCGAPSAPLRLPRRGVQSGAQSQPQT